MQTGFTTLRNSANRMTFNARYLNRMDIFDVRRRILTRKFTEKLRFDIDYEIKYRFVFWLLHYQYRILPRKRFKVITYYRRLHGENMSPSLIL